MVWHSSQNEIFVTSRRGLEYTDSIPGWGLLHPPPKRVILDMTQNFLWRRGSSSEDLGSVEYPFISLLPDPLWLRVVVPVRVSFIVQIDLFKNYSYSIGLYKKTNKKILKNN